MPRQDAGPIGPGDTRTDVAPHGFSPQELWPLPVGMARHKLGLPEQQFIVLQLGRIVPGKGIDAGIRALTLLRSRHAIDAQLLIVGGGPPELPDTAELVRLRALADELGMGAHVRIWGRTSRQQLRYFYGAADVFVTLPQYPPFGSTAVEAMACARPVIGVDAGHLRDIVVDGTTGFLVPPADPEALCRRLLVLQDNPPVARSMGEQGMHRAYQRYTWRSIAGRMATLSAKSAPASGPVSRMQGSEWL